MGHVRDVGSGLDQGLIASGLRFLNIASAPGEGCGFVLGIRLELGMLRERCGEVRMMDVGRRLSLQLSLFS